MSTQKTKSAPALTLRAPCALEISPDAQFHTLDAMHASYQQIVRDHPDGPLVTVLFGFFTSVIDGRRRRFNLDYYPRLKRLTINTSADEQVGGGPGVTYIIRETTIERRQVRNSEVLTKIWTRYRRPCETAAFAPLFETTWNNTYNDYPREPLYMIHGQIPQSWGQLVTEFNRRALSTRQTSGGDVSLTMVVMATTLAQLVNSHLSGHDTISDDAMTELLKLPVSAVKAAFLDTERGMDAMSGAMRNGAIHRVYQGVAEALLVEVRRLGGGSDAPDFHKQLNFLQTVMDVHAMEVGALEPTANYRMAKRFLDAPTGSQTLE
jgi:hypothetical protein